MAVHPEAGAEIDGFRLEQNLSRGGLGQVWRVSRPGAEMPLVMKVPLLQGGGDPLAVVSYETEQMILPRLSGPHAPRFVAAGSFDAPYVVMEFVAGESLAAVASRAPLPIAEVAAIGAAVADALHDIHRQHVTHLDLKPGNVLLRPDGTAALIDFGLARHDQLPDLPAEEFDGPIGSAAGIAPEQLQGMRGDPRSDIFALGCILYLLAIGELPFGEPLSVRGWARRLDHAPAPPRARRPDLPPWLQEIILRCLEVDPARRYQSAGQLAFDLRHPGSVELTERADRTRGRGLAQTVGRWLGRRLRAREDTRIDTAASLRSAPIVMAAVDLTESNARLAEAIRTAVRRVLQTEPGARLACVNVLRVARLALDEDEDAEGRSRHLQRLAELQHWAAPLGREPGAVTFHVVEAVDPAVALLDFARRAHADHIVMGARASSTLRRYLGSVSAHVVAEAPCTVTVVRLPEGGAG